jgi:hypothetical protein
VSARPARPTRPSLTPSTTRWRTNPFLDDEEPDLDDDLDDELEADLDEELEEDGDEDEADTDLEQQLVADDAGEEDEENPGVTVVPPDAEFDDDDPVAPVEDDEDDDEIEGLRDGEFVCRGCFMAKRETQLADPIGCCVATARDLAAGRGPSRPGGRLRTCPAGLPSPARVVGDCRSSPQRCCWRPCGSSPTSRPPRADGRGPSASGCWQASAPSVRCSAGCCCRQAWSAGACWSPSRRCGWASLALLFSPRSGGGPCRWSPPWCGPASMPGGDLAAERLRAGGPSPTPTSTGPGCCRPPGSSGGAGSPSSWC